MIYQMQCKTNNTTYDTTPGADPTGKLLFFPGITDFVGVNPSGSNAIYFDKNSKILIKALRISIPNLRGASWAISQATDPVNDVGINVYDGSTSTPVTGYRVQVSNFEQWIETNILVDMSAVVASSFYLRSALGVGVYTDVRNVQAVYNGIAVYAQIDLLVQSPLIATPSPL